MVKKHTKILPQIHTTQHLDLRRVFYLPDNFNIARLDGDTLLRGKEHLGSVNAAHTNVGPTHR